MIEKDPVKLLMYKSIIFSGWFISGYFAVIFSLMYKTPIGIAISSLVMFVGLFFFITHLAMDFILSINFTLKQTLYEFNMNVNEQVQQRVAAIQTQNQMEHQQAFIRQLLEQGNEMEGPEDEN